MRGFEYECFSCLCARFCYIMMCESISVCAYLIIFYERWNIMWEYFRMWVYLRIFHNCLSIMCESGWDSWVPVSLKRERLYVMYVMYVSVVVWTVRVFQLCDLVYVSVWCVRAFLLWRFFCMNILRWCAMISMKWEGPSDVYMQESECFSSVSSFQ